MRSKKKYLAIVEGEKMETDILEYVLQKYDFNVEVSQEKLSIIVASPVYFSDECPWNNGPPSPVFPIDNSYVVLIVPYTLPFI